MKGLLRSIAAGGVIAGAVIAFTVTVVAPVLPPYVGPPDVKESKSLNLPAANKLQLSNADGWVRVHTSPEGAEGEIAVTAEIRAYLHSGGSWEAARAYVDGLIEAQRDADTLELVTEPQSRPSDFDLRVDYRITVPHGTDIDVAGSNGNVWISEGCGQVAVRGGNSDIEIVEPRGRVRARSTNGRIRLLDAPGNADLETVNGSIYAHMRGGVLEAQTTNGDIVSHVRRPGVKAFDLGSQNGGITVVFHQTPSAEVRATTQRGVIRTDFPINNVTGILETRTLEERLGAGATLLKLETFDGNIWIARG